MRDSIPDENEERALRVEEAHEREDDVPVRVRRTEARPAELRSLREKGTSRARGIPFTRSMSDMVAEHRARREG